MFAVLTVVAIGALVSVGLLTRAVAASEIARDDERDLQARLAAWSAVRMVQASLATQRDELLAGGSPELDDETFEFGGWSVRLASEADGGGVLTPEAALLPAHAMPDGVSDKLSGVIGSGGVSVGAALADPSLGAEAGPLFTVASWEPDVSVLPSDAASRERADEGWTDALRDALAAVLSDEDLGRLEAVFERDGAVATRGEMAARLESAEIDASAYGAVLDTVRFGEAVTATGRVDLSRASAEVLGVLPGLDEASAEAIVGARGALSADERATIAWPLAQGLIDAEAFAAVADVLTARSLQWGGRFEVYPTSDEPEAADDTAPVLVLEVVFDAAGESCRVVMIRDRTYSPMVLPPEAEPETEPEEGFDEATPGDGLASDPSTPERSRFASMFIEDDPEPTTNDAADEGPAPSSAPSPWSRLGAGGTR